MVLPCQHKLQAQVWAQMFERSSSSDARPPSWVSNDEKIIYGLLVILWLVRLIVCHTCTTLRVPVLICEEEEYMEKFMEKVFFKLIQSSTMKT